MRELAVRIIQWFLLDLVPDIAQKAFSTGEPQLFYLKDTTIMNLHQARGTLYGVGGTFLQGLGRLTGNKQLQQRGFALRMSGKSQSAIGDAQNIIRMYVKRNGVPGQG